MTAKLNPTQAVVLVESTNEALSACWLVGLPPAVMIHHASYAAAGRARCCTSASAAACVRGWQR